MKKILADFADVLRAKCYTHLCGMLDVYQYNDRKSLTRGVNLFFVFSFCEFAFVDANKWLT